MAKKYFTDNEGYKHEAEFTADEKPISDKKYNRAGELIDEGVYENGKFVGYKKYFTDNEGYKHEAEFTADERILSEKKYDKNGKLVENKQGIFKQAIDGLKQKPKSSIVDGTQKDSR